MTRTLAGLLVSIALVCASLLPSATTAQGSGRANRPPDQLRGPGTAGTQRHPKMHAAIGALQAAKVELEHADNDFGGHKKDALDSVDNALKQLRLALQFEKY